jgi:hypothetical protein
MTTNGDWRRRRLRWSLVCSKNYEKRRGRGIIRRAREREEEETKEGSVGMLTHAGIDQEQKQIRRLRRGNWVALRLEFERREEGKGEEG